MDCDDLEYGEIPCLRFYHLSCVPNARKDTIAYHPTTYQTGCHQSRLVIQSEDPGANGERRRREEGFLFLHLPNQGEDGS
jgi:hypothetical protein